MRFNKLTLQNPAFPAGGAGTAQLVQQFINKYIQVAGTFVATVNLEGTIDGTNWITLHAALSTGTLYSIPQTVEKLRLNVTAYTSGAPLVTFSGQAQS